MSDLKFIKAADGRKMRDPFSRMVLKAEGQWVAWISYWQRALAAGDVIEATPPGEAQAKVPAPDAAVKPAPLKDASNA